MRPLEDELLMELASNLRELVKRGQLNDALDRLINFFRDMETNLQFAGMSFPFPVYDDICASIGEASAFRLLAPGRTLTEMDHDVVVVTEGIFQGGHVELIRDIADACERKLLIVATNLHNHSGSVVVVRALRAHPNVIDVITLDSSKLITRVQSLQALIANPSANRIMAMCHSYDAVAISAIAPVKDKPVLFFHHCDHTPCLGCYMSHAEHIDLHNVAFQQCQHELGLDPGYICMTSRESGTRRDGSSFAKPVFKSISCGGEHKLLNFKYPISYPDVVVEIIRSKGGTHFHVGRISGDFVEHVRGALFAAGMPPESFVHIGHVSGFREIIHTLEIDLYVPTLPQGGGKASIDAMSAGTPVLVHENALSRLWGGRDLVYPEAPNWNDLGTLKDCLRKFDDESYWRDQVRASRAYFEANHSNELFQKMLEANGRLPGAVPPPLKPYRPSYHVRLNAAILPARN
ncbi:glycosyltransferase [Rhizobium terrae]|uniref:glycosyltransferase n=1 Tax=Rhizobium terrae TaxID=2171756 RepID=UPI0013C31DAE|nr:hypothetical protein [Rhizobium terrae]